MLADLLVATELSVHPRRVGELQPASHHLFGRWARPIEWFSGIGVLRIV